MPEQQKRAEPGELRLDSVPMTVRPLTPSYITAADGPWIQALLLERARFSGERRGSWRARMEQPLPVHAPTPKLRIALDMLDRMTRDRCTQPVSPKDVRAALFRAAVHHPRASALVYTAEQLGLTPSQVLIALFADLPDERVLSPLSATVDVMQFALSCNELLIQRLLQQALRVRIVVDGGARALVRHIKWTGLLCVVHSGPKGGQTSLDVSGPYALFRHTRLYANALASLLPRLARCNAYRLEADCVVRGQHELARLTLRSGAPIHPARELPPFDSRVEERFAREFSLLAPQWDIIREPQPIPVGTTLFFPDFQLRRRTTGECYWVEIVGYWTAEYLQKKLAQLERAKLPRLLLCVDEARRCDSQKLEVLGTVVWFKRWIDVRAVISIVDPALALEIAQEPRKKRARRRSG